MIFIHAHPPRYAPRFTIFPVFLFTIHDSRPLPASHFLLRVYPDHGGASLIIHHSSFITLHSSRFPLLTSCFEFTPTMEGLHSSFIIHHSSFITHHPSLITHHSSPITHHSSFIIHHSSFITLPAPRFLFTAVLHSRHPGSVQSGASVLVPQSSVDALVRAGSSVNYPEALSSSRIIRRTVASRSRSRMLAFSASFMSV